jgi:hypothetical protein
MFAGGGTGGASGIFSSPTPGVGTESLLPGTRQVLEGSVEESVQPKGRTLFPELEPPFNTTMSVLIGPS